MDYEKRKRLIVNTAYGAVIFSLVYVAVQYGLKLIMPFLLGFIIAAGLRRPALWISGKWKLPVKPVALALAAVFYCTAGLLAAFAGLKLLSALVDLLPKLPELYTNTVEPTLAGAFAVIEDEISRMDPELMKELQTLFNQFNQSVGEMITGMSVQALGAISASATSLPGLFIKALLMIISTFFIAADYDLLAGFAARQFTGQTGRFRVRIRQYVVGTLFVCIRSYAIIMSITFFELSLGLSLIGIKNAVLIAFCIAVFDILPVLGTGGIMIPWVILEAVQGNLALAVKLLAVYLIITVVRNIIEPKIVGSQLGLHPVVTLSSMFVGAQLFGVVGLFGFPILLSLLKNLNDTGTIRLFR